jgi:hypothetical protein
VAPVARAGEGTPFVGQQMAALGAAWELTWPNVRLSLPSARGAADQYARTVTVHLAQASGQFLGGTLRAAGELPPGVRPTPGGAAAQDQLRRAGESYAGLPTAAPRVSLLRALDAVFMQGVGPPLYSREIQALYVTLARQGRAPAPVWVITLNGFPPMPESGPHGAGPTPAWQRNHMRNVVDANTGRLLFATTVPQPIQPPPLLVS